VIAAGGAVIADCARFLDRLETRGLSTFTVEAYAYDLALIHRWLGSEGLALSAVTSEGLHRFLAWERGRDSKPKSINRRLHTLRLYFRFVVGRELPGGVERRAGRRTRRDFELGMQRVVLPATRQVRVKEPKPLVEPLTADQVRELLGSLRRYRDLCIAHLMLLCGLRSREVLQLRVRDLDFEDRRIRVSGKGNKERALPLPPLLIALVRKYLLLERPASCRSDRLFVVLQGARRGDAMTRAALRKVFRTRRKRAALSAANQHRLRHTFGTDMARSGVRLPILQRMMGHANAETTLLYVNVSLADVASEFQRAVEKLETQYGMRSDDR
jgi:site-specific recombinase XerD